MEVYYIKEGSLVKKAKIITKINTVLFFSAVGFAGILSGMGAALLKDAVLYIVGGK